MYTLRIIKQSLTGTEERKNIYLGESYDVLMKTPLLYQEDRPVVEGYYGFEDAIREFTKYSDEKQQTDNIVGFVYGNGSTYPIRDFNVVYIVGNGGQTIERIYGIYEKY